MENVESILEDSAGVTDPSGAEADTPVSEKVERVTITTTGVRRERIEVLTFQFLRKYLYYAKTRVRPILSKEAADVITQAYASLRNQEDNKVRRVPPVSTLPHPDSCLLTVASWPHRRCR